MAENLTLNAHHNEMIGSYLRFAKFQRERHLKSLHDSFENTKLSRLQETTFTSEEVQEIMDELCDVIKGDVELELMSSAHTASLLLCQLCSQAQQWHLTLQANISELENRDMLEKISQFEKGISGSLEKSLTGSPIKMNKLEPLSENAGANKLLQMEINRLKDENKKLIEKLKEVEFQTVAILEKKSLLSENLIQVQKELKEWKESKAENVEKDLKHLEDEMIQVRKELEASMSENALTQKTLENDLVETKQRLMEVQSQLQLAEKELEMKLSQTSAFRNMKQILAAKNEQIKTLRNQLSKYEAKDDNDE